MRKRHILKILGLARCLGSRVVASLEGTSGRYLRKKEKKGKKGKKVTIMTRMTIYSSPKDGRKK